MNASDRKLLIKFLILKAFVTGDHICSDTYTNLGQVVCIVDSALDTLGNLSSPDDDFWLAFFWMLKCEIVRRTQNEKTPECRAKMWGACRNIDYEDYMQVVQRLTQSQRHVDERGNIVDDGVESDAACYALGLDKQLMNDKLLDFVYRTTLKEILDKLDVPYGHCI